MQKLIEVNAAREFANTFLADPILKMAVNAVLNNCPAHEEPERPKVPTAPISPIYEETGLRPCPFCGAPAELVKEIVPDGNVSYTAALVRCTKCFMQTQYYDVSGYYGGPVAVEEGIKALWNRRAVWYERK